MNLYALLSLISVVLYLQIILLVLVKDYTLKIHRIFSLLSFLFAIYAFGNFMYFNTNSIEKVYAYDRIASISWVFFPLMSVWFFMELTKMYNPIIKVIFFGFLIPCSLWSFVAAQTRLEELKYFYFSDGNLFYIPNVNSSDYHIYIAYLVVCLYVITFLLIRWLHYGKLNQHRVQAKILLATIALYFVLSIFSNFVLPYLESPWFLGMDSFTGLVLIGGGAFSLLKVSGKVINPDTIYKLLINHIKEFMFLLDKNGNIYASNSYTLSNLHYNSYELLKVPAQTLIPSYDKVHQVIQMMGSRKVSRQIRLDLMTKQGKSIPVMVSVVKILGDYENLLGYVLTCTDYRQMLKLKEEVAERVRTEKNLFQIRKELEFLVKKRTFELQEANQKLQLEVIERKRAEEQIKGDLDEKVELVQEIHHRVKNNIQMIISLINMLSNHPRINQVASDKLREIAEKVRYISRIHEDFYSSPNLSNIEFSKYLKKATGELYSNYGRDVDVIFKLNIADEYLEINQAIPMGIIFNELMLNVLRHAFRENSQKRKIVNIEFYKKQQQYSLVISDNGSGLPENINEIKKHKIGLQLVEILAKDHLKGEIKNYGSFGTTFIVNFTG
jgi:PAS domain S-box-containing protein